MRINNLFSYATSELSQDAFICWLLSHAREEGWDFCKEIRECAIDFMKVILSSKGFEWKQSTRITDIKKQYKNIDVLVEVGEIKVIIEDKTFTDTHNNQINRYKNYLIEKDEIDEKNIICVYYKIEEQPYPEPYVDIEFTRKDMLNIFSRYKNSIKSSIFVDYLEYLEWIDEEVNLYTKLNIDAWWKNGRAYIGFFKHLQETLLKEESVGWGYVPNPTGGFMGLWWYNLFTEEELIRMGFGEYSSNLYIQIENDTIAVKYSLDVGQVKDWQQVYKLRWGLYKNLKIILGNEFEKKRYARGHAMTVGLIKYNEKNYEEKLTLVHNAMLSLKEKDFASYL